MDTNAFVERTRTMTRTEARNTLITAFPDRSICIEAKDWHYAGGDYGRPRDAVEFRVAILPGWEGSKCSQATAFTLEKAVELAVNWAPLIPDQQQVQSEADACFAEGELVTA
jgi:hypothetical protein